MQILYQEKKSVNKTLKKLSYAKRRFIINRHCIRNCDTGKLERDIRQIVESL